MWYCRHEIQIRQALFFSAASVAGAFSGLLAFAIAKMDGIGGLEGWRWIFILEGIATVVVAVIAFFLLYDFPETASFLTEEERAFIVFRLKYQSGKPGQGEENRVRVPEAEEFKMEYVWAAFKDWQLYVHLFVYWGVSNNHSRGWENNSDRCRSCALSTASASSCLQLSRRLDIRAAPPS